ncbi:TPA: hypothetical protein UMV36_003937 [Stenotrophomonas maltophilia]|nr:hypothetical protein [Stenotrophomonas maltophilia]MBH1711301.1 hypothetical protein [Stenotrophomonas maltophilia]HEL3759497.1 hypothetical protein [Stenotrophomonas maltophilia]
MLDRVWQEQDDGFPGVWCYEVAEPFGYLYGEHLQQGGDPDAAEQILRGIVAAGTSRTRPPEPAKTAYSPALWPGFFFGEHE